MSHPRTGYTLLLDSLLSIYFTNWGPTLGTKVCHQYFVIPISSTQCTPVSSWSNRPLLSGGDSSCSWVFCSCTGPQGETYTQLEGWQLMSPVAITLIWNRVHSRGYSHEKTQTSSFHVRFIEIPVLEHRVVSQQCNGMQYTSPNIEMQIHMP